MREFVPLLRTTSSILAALLAGFLVRDLHAVDPLPGWPQPLISSRFAVANLQGGPELEIVSARSGLVSLFSASGTLLAEWVPPPGPGTIHEILVGDIVLESPGLEVAILVGGQIHVLSSQLAPIQVVESIADQSGGNFYESPCLVDVDGDGDLELIGVGQFSLSSGHPLGRFQVSHVTASGVSSQLFQMPDRELLPWQFQSIRVSDLNFDGSPEFSPVRERYPWPALEVDQELLPGFPIFNTGPQVGQQVFADVDLDGTADIIGCASETLIGYRGTGSVLFAPVSIPGTFLLDPIVGNFDLDEDLEIAVGGRIPGSPLRIFDPVQNSFLWEYPGPHDLFSFLSAGDLNGDGVDDLVGVSRQLNGTIDEWVHAFDGVTHSELPGFPIEISISAGPLFVVDLYDVDADGDLELVFAADGLLQILNPSNPGEPVSRASWPTRGGNLARNGDYHWDRGPFPNFVRGDTNFDGGIDLADAVNHILVLIGESNTDCILAFDVDSNGECDLSDSMALLSYLFSSGAPPMQPFPECSPQPRTSLCSVRECP